MINTGFLDLEILKYLLDLLFMYEVDVLACSV